MQTFQSVTLLKTSWFFLDSLSLTISSTKRKVQGTIEGKLIFESILENIFNYSLGGYYHRERWARTRRYHSATQAATGKMQGIFFT
jgi:hypothetical protein